MKAIRVHKYGGPEVLKIEEFPMPQPSPDQVLVRIHAVGVNPYETYIRSGMYASAPGVNSQPPYTPGRDAAGVIEEVGSNVTSVKTGDRVYISFTSTGAYAEYCLCGANDVHPLPDNTSFAQGSALATPYVTAYRALFQLAQAVPGQNLLVHGGSGGVGIAATQMGRAAGLTVFATAGTPKGRKLVLANGAHHVLNHHETGYLEKALELTGNKGFDVIIEMAAKINLAKDLTALAKRGRVIVVGSRGPIEINPRDLMQRDGQILAMLLFNASPAERMSAHAAIIAGLENGTLRPVIGRIFPLEKAAQAQDLVMQPGAYGKIVLEPKSEKKQKQTSRHR
jgi:NADPH2:quinone reductase